MYPNDETIYQAQVAQDGNENETQYQEMVEETNEQKAPKSEKSSNGWAKVAVGGVTGVLMGAAGMYAGKPYVDDVLVEGRSTLADWMEANGMEELAQNVRPEGKPQAPDNPSPEPDPIFEPEPIGTPTPEKSEGTIHVTKVDHHVTVTPISGPLEVAHVDQSMSFADAFAHARAEVGPGGLFQWHGGVFNTYTETEWDSMSATAKSDFAHHAAPVIKETIETVNDDEPEIAIAIEDDPIDVNLIDEGDTAEDAVIPVTDGEGLTDTTDDHAGFMDTPYDNDLGTSVGMDDTVADDLLL